MGKAISKDDELSMERTSMKVATVIILLVLVTAAHLRTAVAVTGKGGDRGLNVVTMSPFTVWRTGE